MGSLDGRYAAWLTDTGLVTAQAYDGVAGITELTDGRVQQVDLSGRLELGRTFSWVPPEVWARAFQIVLRIQQLHSSLVHVCNRKASLHLP